MGLFRYTSRTFARELLLILGALAFTFPVYLLVSLSLKSEGDIYAQPLNPLTQPEPGNYQIAWQGGQGISLGRALMNTTILTVGTVIGLIAIGSLCAWVLARRPSKMSTATYIAFLLGLIIPFQLGIVPLYVVMRNMGLVPSYGGMILLNIGLWMPLTVFLYTGFVRAMSPEYEEAAQIDGAGLIRTFTRVVFPLLRPVTGTVAVLTGVSTWNEFFLPLVFLSGSDYQPIPVTLYTFVGEYTAQWNYIFAGVVLSIVPVIAFYLFAQRELIKGFSGGIRG